MIILLAFCLDYCFDQPPVRWHPVVWIGRYLGWMSRRIPSRPFPAFVIGCGAWWLGASIVGGAAWGVGSALHRLPYGLEMMVTALLLWPTFARRMLHAAADTVARALEGSLGEGREAISRLVSRPVDDLSEASIREAVLETTAENLTDSVLAPLLAFACFGLPGAAIYRFANTADAMWGYRDHREWFGKWAARVDDVFNWIPARIAGVVIWSGATSWRRLQAQSRLTPSPNGGWTMGALALALGVSLGKPGVYRLNSSEPAPDALALERGLRRLRIASLVVVGLAVVVEMARG